MLLSSTMELNRLESTTAVKIGVCRYIPVPAGIPDPTLGRTTTGSTGNGYTRGSGRVGSGRVVKTIYPQTPSVYY